MLDQTAEATLKYVVDSGISAIELMGGPVESFAGRPRRVAAAAVVAAGRGGDGVDPAAARGSDAPPPAMSGSWNGQPCALPGAGGGGWRRWPRTRRSRRDDARAAGGAAGAGGEAEGVAHQRLDGRVQEAAQDVQRRRRDDLRVEAAQSEHVGRGVRVHLQRRRSPRRARTRRSSCRPTRRSSSGSATSRRRRRSTRRITLTRRAA